MAAVQRHPAFKIAPAREPRGGRWIRGLLDRVLLVAAVLCAGALPSYIAQYRQRLGGRLDQVIRDLAPFQEIANQLHGGSLDALIRYHLASPDKTFHAEGQAIQDMVNAEAALRSSAAALDTDLWHQLWYLSTNLDHGMAGATWHSFVPSIPLTLDALVFAAVVGVFVWLVFIGVWALVARVLRS
jgi:Protein of unknown function (DUF2937)